MMRRAAQSGVAAALLALAACSSAAPPTAPAKNAEHIACALAGAKVFAPDCVVERARVNGIVTLIVHHPDGASRRFDVLEDGRGLAVADGTQQAITRFEGGFAELAVGTDRYRFPIKLNAAQGGQ